MIERKPDMRNFEYKSFKARGQGHFVFTPIRAKRHLQEGMRSDIFQQEEVAIKLDYIFNPNGAISEEEMIKLHETIRVEAEKLITNVEILAMASKVVPEWLENMKPLKCVENFSSK